MIREFEKKILLKINLANRYLTIKNKFIKDGQETRTFNKSEITKVIKELGYPCEYKTGGWYYVLTNTYKHYKFVLAIQIRSNILLFYINVYKDDKFLEEANLSHISYMLNFLPYDESLIKNNFGLNPLEDMKEYLKAMLELFEEFVNEYILEIEAGNNP
jgi:hypothetical protein